MGEAAFTLLCWRALCAACPAVTVKRWEGTSAPTCCASCGALIASLDTAMVTVEADPS